MSLTAIEAAIQHADATGEGDGYHIHLTFPDGSVVAAPHVQYGPNWIAFDQITDDPLFVDTSDAVIQIEWGMMEIVCEGPRFAKVKKDEPRPGM